ncbi:MAG: TRAP transporter substrate-binding protein DctP [Burkholderiales bacterium]|nr:TRAP transporter substrate-binding protein DctP [Burkholderiales bacterium]
MRSFVRAARPALLSWLAILASACASAQTPAKPSEAPELKLSVAQSAAYPLGKAADRWVQLVNDAAGRSFVVKPYPGAVLAGRDPQREFGVLRDGLADLAVGSALAWSAQLPSFAVYALPWLASETRELEALVADDSLRQQVAARAALAGVVVVAVAPLGERVLSTAKSVIPTLSELAGLRVRVVAIPLLTETFATLGAKPSSMSFASAQAAFADGSLDAQEAPASTLAATRIAATGQKFVTRWGAFNDVMVFAVRRSVWEGWSDDQRALVRTHAAQVASEAGAVAREEAALAELTQQGVTLLRPTPAQRMALRAAVQPVWARWAAIIGTDLVGAAEAAVAAAVAR